jgi:hypothetical protein
MESIFVLKSKKDSDKLAWGFFFFFGKGYIES